MSIIGSYRGIKWRRMRMCDLLGVEYKCKVYAIEADGTLTGDNFNTQKEMRAWIDELLDADPYGRKAEFIDAQKASTP